MHVREKSASEGSQQDATCAVIFGVSGAALQDVACPEGVWREFSRPGQCARHALDRLVDFLLVEIAETKAYVRLFALLEVVASGAEKLHTFLGTFMDPSRKIDGVIHVRP
jgi:hypothetical protein